MLAGRMRFGNIVRSFWFVLPVLIAWFVYLPYADRHQIATSSSAFLRWLGLAVFGITYWLRIESIRAQGPQFSCAVSIQERHRLTTSGPYRWMRHPAYTGVIGIIAGASLVFANPVAARSHDWTRLGLDGNANSG